jgi:class 3 adenylate cyclase/tetratricopeptide (TPR) repeat protein
MKCSKCQFENPQGQKFCGECGTKLEIVCSKCNSPNPPQFKFCGECGHKLNLPSEPAPKALSFDEKLKKIQKYLPKGITEKILSQRDRIEGERKQITVMFCDMEGFTPLSEKLGPEEMYTLMDGIYEILIHKVHDYEGTVNEMTGDGIMALFGAPITLEDAPQRAIRSAMAIHREMTNFNERMKQERGDLPLIKMRVGIHTGPVVVGTLGNDLRVEFKAVGDTVNLGSRVEGLADPGKTYVTEDTFKLTEGFFRFEALGEKSIKGKEAPIKVYQVIAPSSRRTRFDVSAERGLTPFVGRERELELLLDGFERSKEGRGQAISIISDAGIGKSRLLYEFRKAVVNEPITFLEGRCLSYSRNVAYHPVVDSLKATFEIQDNDTEQGIREKVSKGLQALKVDEASTLPYLLDLLAVKESGIEKIPMSSESRKHRTLEAMKRVVLKGAEFRPLIMAIEDLHWMDRSSEDTFKELLESISAARVFLIFTYRPEFVHTWGSRSYHSQITLNRLSNRESLAMASHILCTADIDRDLENLILQKTEGIPFFIEEFIRSLKDLGVIEKRGSQSRLSKDILKLTIPSTIQDMIMARVDTLPEGAREVLKTGSVIEREFSHDLIERVTGLPEQELLSHLSSLKDSEFLYERGIYPESTYIFKHALTREVIYESLLERKKRELHDRIGNAIENTFESHLSEHYGALTNHFMRSKNFIKAAQYAMHAAKKNQRAGSLTDAILYGQHCVSALERLPRTQELDRSIIDARTTLGLYYNQTNNFVLSREAVEPVLGLVAKYDYKRRMAQVNAILGAYAYAVEEDFAKASDQLREAINAAEATGDLISLVMANHWMGHVFADNCEFDQALPYLNKGLEINTLANILWGISAHKSCIARTVYLFQGKVNVGYPMSLEGLQTAEESGDAYSKAEAHFSMGFAYLEKRQLVQAKKHLLEGCGLCERFQFVALHSGCEWCLGEVYFLMEQYGESKKHYANAIRVLNLNSLLPSFARGCELAMARSMVLNHEKVTNLDALLTYIDRNRVKIHEGKLRRQLAEIWLNLDEPKINEAESWVHEAIVADTQNGLRFDLARDLCICGEVYTRKGDPLKAKGMYGEAVELFKECGAEGWVERYEMELAKLK